MTSSKPSDSSWACLGMSAQLALVVLSRHESFNRIAGQHAINVGLGFRVWEAEVLRSMSHEGAEKKVNAYSHQSLPSSKTGSQISRAIVHWMYVRSTKKARCCRGMMWCAVSSFGQLHFATPRSGVAERLWGASRGSVFYTHHDPRHAIAVVPGVFGN